MASPQAEAVFLALTANEVCVICRQPFMKPMNVMPVCSFDCEGAFERLTVHEKNDYVVRWVQHRRQLGIPVESVWGL